MAGEPFRVQFEHDGINATSYQLRLDGGVVQTLPVAARVGGTGTFTVTAGLAAGTHAVVVETVGAGGTTGAAPVSLPISPAPPQPPPPPGPQGAPSIARGTIPQPVTWTSALLGTPAIGGSWVLAGDRHTVTAAGTEIWGVTDQGRVVMQQRTGDFDVIARVESFTGPDPFSKAGVMVRQSLLPGSQNVFLAATVGQGWTLQWRTSSGGISASVNPKPPGTAPGWVRLARRGNVFTASRSVDGVTWTAFSSQGTRTVVMSGPVYVGLAVTSQNVISIATAAFTNVTVQ